ncbi:MAG TPA: ABC transporter permease, partial [Thermoanaerobaculia bacterium]|nr:ABC transporter permease [Thermoanaerobaculia bacterium]
MHLLADLRTAFRRLAQSPGFTLAAALTLALGIGANTTLFSIVDAVVLKPLPYARPAELMAIQTRRVHAVGDTVSAPDFLDWRRESHAFQSMAAYTGQLVVLAGRGEPERLPAERVSPALFPLFGARAAFGR